MSASETSPRRAGPLIAWLVFVGAAHTPRVRGSTRAERRRRTTSRTSGPRRCCGIHPVLVHARGHRRIALIARGWRCGRLLRCEPALVAASARSRRARSVVIYVARSSTNRCSRCSATGVPTEEQGLVPNGWDSSRAAPFIAFFVVVTLLAPASRSSRIAGSGSRSSSRGSACWRSSRRGAFRRRTRAARGLSDPRILRDRRRLAPRADGQRPSGDSAPRNVQRNRADRRPSAAPDDAQASSSSSSSLLEVSISSSASSRLEANSSGVTVSMNWRNSSGSRSARFDAVTRLALLVPRLELDCWTPRRPRPPRRSALRSGRRARSRPTAASRSRARSRPERW